MRHSMMSLENCQCLIISISVDQLDVIITTNMFKPWTATAMCDEDESKCVQYATHVHFSELSSVVFQ